MNLSKRVRKDGVFLGLARKMWEDDKNPNTLRNFNPYKIRFKKKFLKGFQKHRGGGQGRLEKFQMKADFFFGWLP